jgi:hypothetical protein
VKTLFRKIAQALPGMDNSVSDASKDQSEFYTLKEVSFKNDL